MNISSRLIWAEKFRCETSDREFCSIGHACYRKYWIGRYRKLPRFFHYLMKIENFLQKLKKQILATFSQVKEI